MKKTFIVLAVVFLGGCGPSFCDSSSPAYDPQRCQDYTSQMWQMQQQHQQQINQQMQMRHQQQQLQNLEMEQWRTRTTLERSGYRF